MAESAAQPLGTTLGRAPIFRLACATATYMWLVALWGAVVRITKSGDGCGQHWPTCHGEVLHVPRNTATWIELSHRLTTGLALPLVIALAVGAWLTYPKGSRVRSAALAGVALTIVEALIGARLVLGRLVGTDASLSRAIVMPAHLVTTSLLLASLALTAFWSRPGPDDPGAPRRERSRSASRVGLLTGAGAVGILVVSAAGALTALGDTLFPIQSSSFGAGLFHDRGEALHFLERLRVIHPLAAVAVSGLLLFVTSAVARLSPSSEVLRLKLVVSGLVWLGLGIGLLNVLLSAPGYMQVIHLAVATGLWLSFVLFGAAALDEARARA
jgi:cytochrome c oxidase assembly protein subunit 15